jgi:plastocyanin
VRRSLTILLPAAFLPTALALAAGIATVSQQGRAFLVHDLQIARGDTVHFTNDDDFTHQIYVNSPSFNFESAEQAPGQAVDLRFPTAGLFEVRCHIHPKMLLHVDVR